MSDYTVSRKRKRHAVDPCLGFYLLSSGKVLSSPSSKSSNNSPNGFGFKALAACTEFHKEALVPSSIEKKREGICDASQHLTILPDHGHQHTPKCAQRIQPMNPSSENLRSSSNIVSGPERLMVTVEDFLRRSTKREAVTKKQYGRSKRRIKRLDDNGALFEPERQHEVSGSDAGDTGQDMMQLRSKKIRRATRYESSSDESLSLNHGESSPLENQKRKTRSRILKPLKERLYAAAVLTHGHPDDILVHATGSELAPSRRPLCFVPNTQPELDGDQMDKRRPQTWSLVDPRKSMAIRTASFSSKIRPCLQHMGSTSGKPSKLSLHPPKRWKFADTTLLKNRQPKTPAVKRDFEYPPLAFVSLKEAEEDYKTIFSSSNYKRNGRLPYTSTLPMVSVADIAPCVEGCTSNLTCNMHMVPLEEAIQRPNLAIEVSAPVAVDPIKTLDLNDMPSALLTSSPIINSVSSPTGPVPPVTPKSTQDRPITRIIPARRGSSRAIVRESASMRRGSDVTPKSMRPLASFFDEFIQNIRNVAVSQDQLSVPDKYPISKRSLLKASRSEHNPRQCHIDDMQLRPGATNLTDTAEPWTKDLESIRQNNLDYRDHMDRQRTPDFSYNRRLSPDILAVLDSHNYQVILSSPS